jgi:hypothetical protein
MKRAAGLLLIAILVIVGCIYEAPLTEEHKILIDPSVLGLWEEVPDKDEPPDQAEKMLILKYSATEYLVHYPMGKGGMYLRIYPIKIGGVSCLQVQLIGEEAGVVPKDEPKYHVISYTLSNGELEIKTLNTDIVNKNLKESAALRRAFIKNKDQKNLFVYPGKFRRVKGK